MAVERTLSIVKPDAVARNIIGEIYSRFEKSGLRIVACRMMQLTQDKAAGFYAEHEGKPFYAALLEYMSSGPVVVLVLSGEDLSTVLGAVIELSPVPGRMQAIPNTLDLQVIVDYAHTPQALEQVLQALRPHVQGALVTVFGCGGDRDREKRQIMGRIACAMSDRVVVTSDNPRTESPARIMQDIEAGCSGQYEMIEDRAEAIDTAVSKAGPGDCVVIAGKGHEEYQLIDGARLHFSDQEQASKALARRAG